MVTENSSTRLLSIDSMDKYQRRNLIICVFIFIVVLSTVTFIGLIFIGGVRLRSLEEFQNDNAAPTSMATPTASKPNILLIMADDLRPSLSCYGDSIAITPNIDQIANYGTLFTNAYAQEAICAPSRTSLLTSRRPDTLHLYANDRSYGYWRNTVGNFTTLPQYFKENGYYTVSVGKIFHDGEVSNKTDDYPYSWTQIPFHPPTKKHKMDKVCPDVDGKLHMNLICPVDVSSQPGGTLPDIESVEFVKTFLENYAEDAIAEPFFLGMGFYKPHIPLKYPREYLDYYDIEGVPLAPNPVKPSTLPPVAWNPWVDIRGREDMAKLNISFPYGPMPNYTQAFVKQSYYASITYIDDLLGQVLETLEDTGLAKNTIIAFLGDHGWSLGEHQEWSKYSNYEIALNVPLIISLPRDRAGRALKRVKARRRSPKGNAFQASPRAITEMVELVDLFPSLVDLAGLGKIPQCGNDTSLLSCTEGLSFAPLLSNQSHSNWKTAVFSQYPRPSAIPRDDSDQPTLENVNIMGYTMRTDRYRYTEWVAFNHSTFKPDWNQVVARELYDHHSDWLEDVNLAYNWSSLDRDTPFAVTVSELSAQLRLGWMEENVS